MPYKAPAYVNSEALKRPLSVRDIEAYAQHWLHDCQWSWERRLNLLMIPTVVDVFLLGLLPLPRKWLHALLHPLTTMVS